MHRTAPREQSAFKGASTGLHLVIAAMTTAIAIADLTIPLGIAVWVLYVGPIALSNFSTRPNAPFVTAVACSVGLATGYFFSSGMDAEAATYSELNRLFAFATFWAAAYIGRRFIVARQVVEREEWLQAGESGILGEVSGELDVETLGNKVLSFLASYLGAQIGAIYFSEPEGGLRRFAAYALDPATAGPELISEGEGLVGQAARDDRIVSIRDVPDEYLDVRSALGGSKPRELLVAPASADGRVHAVIELGTLGAFSAVHRELLSRASHAIATAVLSIRHVTRQRELLEETQRQAEQLQAQEEELRVQNEELEQQARALEETQANLEQQHAELEAVNSELEAQAHALERERDELARARLELERSSAYKSEFLANVSHELRTPLNSSLILAKLLQDNREGNLTAEQIKYAETIYTAGNDLLTLINDILDLSKIEAGQLDVRLETVPIRRTLDELSATFSPIAKQRGLELDAIAEPGLPASIHTDGGRLQQILKNLLSNALKFTERGGVSLAVRRARDGRVAFDVRDTGIGIPLDQQEVIFEAFRQADGTIDRKFGGTGLGLSISRDLARLLGGDLEVDSAPGRGSTFTLILPERFVGSDAALERRPPRHAEAHHALPRGAAHRPSPAPALSPTPAPAPIPDDRDALDPDARSILIIEDDVAFIQVLKDLVHELDFRVLVAQTGEEGIAMAAKYRPSAIVLDVGLPDRSGLSVLDALKHGSATRHIPVHVMSVSDYTQTALEMGAVGYAIKPVVREQIVSALAKLEAKFTQKLRRVLVVEDDAVLRESTCRLLASGDVEAVGVGSAGEALDQLQASTFDCMVLDLALPDRTGFELLEEMAEQDEYAFPPVVVYTGRSLSREEEQQLRRFSNSIIIKGARSPERLLDEVTLFVHQVEAELPPEHQRMLRAARSREAVFEGRRVLIVEDDVRNIFALSSVLEPKGAKVEIARNGREAVEHLSANPGVDLVLMDIMMPEMDGLTATREIRKRAEHAKLPIIALTAKAMPDDRDKCLAAGANDYIAKPLDVDKFLSLARVWMPR